MKMKKYLSFIFVLIISLGIVGVSYAENEQNCNNPILSIQNTIPYEWEYDTILTVEFECESEIKVELIDAEFDAILETQIIINNTNFELEYSLFEDIPYCINVITNSTTNDICWIEETEWATTELN